MVVTLTLALVTSLGSAATGSSAEGVRVVPNVQPRISVWTDRDEDPYHQGDRVRVYFSADRDAYVTIMRVDTDGRVRVLFPVEPWEDNFARGGITFEVLGRASTPAFRIDDAPGLGYIFALSSLDPFDYREISLRDRWDYRVISDGRIEGDPYVALTDLAARLAYDYDYDIVPYYVERHYDYPRFVCYDCHAYATYHRLDPYRTYCTSFRIVIYDDPYYYPYRRYGGRHVVLRPRRPGPRYVFKDADGRRDYITRVSRRPQATDRRRAAERDRTSTDIGGGGAVPAPVGPRSRRPSPAAPAGAPATPRRPDAGDRVRPVVPSRRPAGEAKDDRRRVAVPRPDEGTPVPSAEKPARPGRRVTRDQPDRTPSKARSNQDDGDRVVRPRATTRSAPRRGETPTRVRRPAPQDRKAQPRRVEPKKPTPPPRKSTGKPELKRRRKS